MGACDDGSSTPSTDGGGGDAITSDAGGGSDAGPIGDAEIREDGSATDGGTPMVDSGTPAPAATSICNGDGTCDRGETCGSCASDCGSCDVAELTGRRDKFVDEGCEHMGDGLSDECAASTGAPGRFNELQTALESLEAGDTLHLHPGDYFRDVEGRDSGGIYTMEASGTAERPIVITAADRSTMPTIHSCDPSEPSHCPMPALAVYGDHAIVDHLAIRGRVQVWGATASVMQYLECTHGWGACGDGNWSCLRIESCTDCIAHHNYVHDIAGDGFGGACPPGVSTDFPDRGAGLKEFQSEGTIWEFNTVTRAPRWAYDLHRNSENTTLRFNDFAAFPGDAIRIHRTRNVFLYGNVMVARDAEPGTCINVWGRNERVEAEPHVAEVHHNTCVGANTGISVQGEVPSLVHDNVVQGLRSGAEDPRNVVVASDASELSNNAYDSAGNYRRITYEDSTWSESLAEWQSREGWDAESVETEGGSCAFTMPPSGDGEPYDVRASGGVCATLARDGGEVGAFGVTDCVGHRCP
jgi:hypothetical protein